MIRSRNCYSCNYYKDGYCENLELKPCYPSKGCGDFSKREALEQEPVLDKLRAEVENINVWAMRYEPDEYLDQRPQIVQKVKEHVIEIIDKYKAESEE